MNELLHRLFRYKAWANEELLATLERLGQAPVTTLAIKALSHTYVVDRIFAAHLRRCEHGYASTNPDPLPPLKDLAANIRASDRDYVDYVATLDRDRLAERIDFTFTDGSAGRMSREEMLMHVITHGAGHRGQISAALLLNSATPAVDGFTTYLHRTEGATRRRSGSAQMAGA